MGSTTLEQAERGDIAPLNVQAIKEKLAAELDPQGQPQ
jgi:hypothetical protein